MTKSLTLEKEPEKEREKRWNWNCIIFIAGFVFLGIISGVSTDTFVSFLQLKSPVVTSAFSSYLGLSILIAALVILLIPKVGYKKILLPFPLLIIVSIIAIMYLQNTFALCIFTILFLAGINVSQYVLAPMLSSYTTLENRTKVFSRALYSNMIGTAIGTLFDGKAVVFFFSKYLHISYDKANLISANPTTLTAVQQGYYFDSFKIVFWVVCVLAAAAFLLTLLLKEKKVDYHEVAKVDSNGKEVKEKFNWAIFKNKALVIWVVWTFLISFGAALICPYFPVFLNQFLHIDRGVVSTILALTYVASVIFMMVAPIIEKKFGSVVSISGCFFFTIPLFIIIANGTMFGGFIVVGMGVTMFLRSGFANACQPIQQALPMSFVKKSERAAYNAVVTIFSAGGYILGGIFTNRILFTHQSGYSTAYYITGAFYLVANLLILFVLFKKYNRYTNKKEEELVEKVAG